ncbi:FtsX-like permease family protein [Actinokineospora alba]|uniref:FtsX-like permease family protein n=1 Tax=Actinokineospora alba TaxID=504798 RepID=A0A1H0PDQ6_9PSEU|nr:FtsX-like permease family protein [Actinokineospora alba]TDP65756.1 FtsX-like permease family protein [Actinokineospora alba]SDI65834.1 FtsX-like permease family protein [Actinokineospora alba]SDP03222.1 FtsX-like permease family protein [Actinokineospora alba]
MKAWFNDLVIGVRLAVGGGRTSVARLVLSTVGIGIAVAVLLLASSVGPMIDARYERVEAAQAREFPKIDGVDPLVHAHSGTEFRDRFIEISYVWPSGPTSPVPPGLPSVPLAGEMYVTPGLADLLSAPGSELLRERLPYHTAGLIDASAVADPGDARAYVGVGPEIVGNGREVYGFGVGLGGVPLDPGLLLLLLLGSVALLVPVFIFVASSTRIAGAERDRRLSALRLVGADSAQVRRIAAAESLVSAVAGLVVGAGLFLVGRQLADGVRLMDVSVYPADMIPVWWMVVLVVLAIPVLAVLTAQFALRRTIIEPLGVVRFSKPVRRRMVWRFATVGAGVALLLAADGLSANSQLWSYVIATGATLVLIGVPLLLPWVVERTVAGLRGGPSSWQLAIRRLQLDSGTSARVVGGVAVVLAGAIALQSVLMSLSVTFDVPREHGGPSVPSHATVIGTPAGIDKVVDNLRRHDPAQSVATFREVEVKFPDSESTTAVRVVDCPTIERQLKITNCADGQVFVHPGADRPDDGMTPGRVLSTVYHDQSGALKVYGTWTVPPTRRVLEYWPSTLSWALITTPASGPAAPPVGSTSGIGVDTSSPESMERLRTAVALARWEVGMSSYTSTRYEDPNQQMFVTARRGLLIGSLFTLLLAGTSLLVLALEHIRERRRPLAILAASGVPTGALARSLLWQIAVPIGLGMVLAVAIGVVLAALVMRLAGSSTLIVDWAGVATMSLAAAVLGLLVSLLTLPFLRGATRLSSMRTE